MADESAWGAWEAGEARRAEAKNLYEAGWPVPEFAPLSSHAKYGLRFALESAVTHRDPSYIDREVARWTGVEDPKRKVWAEHLMYLYRSVVRG